MNKSFLNTIWSHKLFRVTHYKLLDINEKTGNVVAVRLDIADSWSGYWVMFTNNFKRII